MRYTSVSEDVSHHIVWMASCRLFVSIQTFLQFGEFGEPFVPPAPPVGYLVQWDCLIVLGLNLLRRSHVISDGHLFKRLLLYIKRPVRVTLTVIRDTCTSNKGNPRSET